MADPSPMKQATSLITKRSLGLSSLCLAITEHSPLPMALVEGAAHIIRYVNPAFCRLMEKSVEELTGHPFSAMVPQEDEAVMLLDRVFRTGHSESHTEVQHSMTHPFFWSYTMWPIIEAGRPLGIMVQITETTPFFQKTLAMNEALTLGSLRQHELTEASENLNEQLRVEISERKRVEESLQQAQDQLTDRAGHLEGLVAKRTVELTLTNRQLEALVYSIAHDLRAPLRAMQGYAVMLIEEAGTELSVAAREFAQRISKSAQFMDSLLLDLLTFSAIAQQQVELTSVNLEKVVHIVLGRSEKDIQEKKAKVEVIGPWPHLLGHEPTLIQVLVNLVNNALKFVPPNVLPELRVFAEKKNERVRVWVEDKGIGIKSDYQAQIFGIFTRLHGEKYPGTGIGLAIVQKGIERMGGKTGVESTLGQGSRFWFELPAAEPV